MRFYNLLSSEKVLSLLLLAIFAAAAIWLAVQPMEVLLGRFLVDDAFYYFQPAANLVKGLGPTFDGEHPTNGYHPLWMGILTGVYYFFPNDKAAPIYVALVLSLAFFYLTVLVFWNILSLFSRDKFLKSVLTALLILNPWVLVNALNGLETALKMLLFALFFWLLLRILHGEERPRTFFFLGITAGLLVLARVDYGLFLAAPAFYLIFKQKDFWRQRALYFFLPAVILPLPWFFYNKIYFGSFVPTSGLAYTLINHQLFFYKPRAVLTVFLWSLHNFFNAAAFSLKTAGFPVFYEIQEPWKSFFVMGGFYIAAPLFLAAYWYRKKQEAFQKFLKDLFNSAEGIGFFLFLIGYLGLLVAHGGIRWSGRAWYFAPFPMLFLFGSGIILSREFFSWWRKPILIALSALLLFSYSSNWQPVFYENETQAGVYRLALWIKDNLPPDARIASFNSGILGYFSDRFVMNADGLINQAAYEAMKKNRLWEFFKQERIDYLVDYEVVLTYRFRPFFGIADPLPLVSKLALPDEVLRILSAGAYGGSQVNIYKLK